MKSLKKIFAGMFVAAAAFGFFGCSDEPEEDESLVVSITGNQNIVTIAAPDEYDGKDVKIVYTIDGTEPSVRLNSSKTDVDVTGTVYSDPFEITENTTTMLIISFDGHDFTTNFTATTATLNNVGPGFGKVGPMFNYGFFSSLSKVVMSLTMIAGRLEIFPLLLLITPSTWKK